jgi:hypothetical protein
MRAVRKRMVEYRYECARPPNKNDDDDDGDNINKTAATTTTTTTTTTTATTGVSELYDLTSDPRETVNLFTEPSANALRDDLRQRLLDWCVKISFWCSARTSFCARLLQENEWIYGCWMDFL